MSELNKKEDLVDQVVACAESIAANAESIVGTEQFMTDLTITIYINRGEIPRVNVDRNFLPERNPLC